MPRWTGGRRWCGAPCSRRRLPVGVRVAGRSGDPAMVLEVLSAELTVSPNHTAGWNELMPEHGLAMRFPRLTGRRREDKEAQDATTTGALVELFRTARRVKD